MNNSIYPIFTAELGFLSNPNDRMSLQDPFKQAAIAQTILDFISELLFETNINIETV